MKKQSIVLLLKTSSGELHVALPILFLFKNKYPDVNIYFASTNENILEKLRTTKIQNDTILEIGECYFGTSKLKVLLKEILFNSSDTIILTCDSGARKYGRLFYGLKLKSSLCFYHHAYALHSYSDSVINAYKLENKVRKGRFPSGSFVLTNSKFDYKWYHKALGFKENKIHVIGALGYSSEWLKHLGVKINKTINSEKKIFIPIRHAHKYYLTSQNYRYQIETIFSIVKKFSNVEFVIKPHPRQSDILEIVQRAKRHNNLKVSNESTLILSNNADLTISFWSSAILDSIAVGTPALEFHIHEVYHQQLIKEENKLKSIYTDLGLAIPISTKEEINDIIEKLDQDNLNCLYQKQRTKFMDVFNINSEEKNNVDVLKNILDETNRIKLSNLVQKVFIASEIIISMLGKKLKIFFLKHAK